MSNTFWAVFLGVTLGYLVTTLIEGVINEIYVKRHTGYLEYLEDQSDDFIEEIKKIK